jgi:septal ring factor EnvC (AmiA/AmiB activator)
VAIVRVNNTEIVTLKHAQEVEAEEEKVVLPVSGRIMFLFGVTF